MIQFQVDFGLARGPDTSTYVGPLTFGALQKSWPDGLPPTGASRRGPGRRHPGPGLLSRGCPSRVGQFFLRPRSGVFQLLEQMFSGRPARADVLDQLAHLSHRMGVELRHDRDRGPHGLGDVVCDLRGPAHLRRGGSWPDGLPSTGAPPKGPRPPPQRPGAPFACGERFLAQLLRHQPDLRLSRIRGGGPAFGPLFPTGPGWSRCPRSPRGPGASPGR